MMKVLVTGFEPFGGESVNPAWEAVRRLAGEDFAEQEVAVIQVPTIFGAAVAKAREAIDTRQPDVVLAVGQARRPDITVERIAINIADAAIEDNAGNRPVDEPIAPDGPAAYFSTLPLKAMVETIRTAGVPARVSNSAGTFVCNHLMYGILHHIALNRLPIRAGFVHVPLLPEQAVAGNVASMGLAELIRGLRQAVITACTV